MKRVALALLAFLCAVPFALASLSPKTDTPGLARSLPRDWSKITQPSEETSASSQSGQFIITDTTEITLDGTACSYNDLPANVTVKLLEVAPDHKTVLKIAFRTPK